MKLLVRCFQYNSKNTTLQKNCTEKIVEKGQVTVNLCPRKM